MHEPEAGVPGEADWKRDLHPRKEIANRHRAVEGEADNS
jgi:hypothetical protein